MSMHVRGSLSPDAYRGLEALCSMRDEWIEITAWMEPEHVAWLVFRLEFVPDNEDTFPRGKWATIQHLQSIVREEAAKCQAAGANDGK